MARSEIVVGLNDPATLKMITDQAGARRQWEEAWEEEASGAISPSENTVEGLNDPATEKMTRRRRVLGFGTDSDASK